MWNPKAECLENVANSLARRGVNQSKLKNLNTPEEPMQCFWNAKVDSKTVPQVQADEFHRENPWTESRSSFQKKPKTKHCRCPINFIHHFSRDEKLPVEQHQCLVNWIKIGTHLEVFWPRRNERGWYPCLVKSVEWWKNQIYFLVSWDQDKSTSWLHLDHFRLRNLKNKRNSV